MHKLVSQMKPCRYIINMHYSSYKDSTIVKCRMYMNSRGQHGQKMKKKSIKIFLTKRTNLFKNDLPNFFLLLT